MRDGYILCVYDGDLCKVPYEEAMSGDYPEYNKREIVKENCGLSIEYGLLIEWSEYYGYRLVEDSWDGFQPVSDVDLPPEKALSIIIQFLECYRKSLNER